MSADLHSCVLWDACANQISNRASPKIVRLESFVFLIVVAVRALRRNELPEAGRNAQLIPVVPRIDNTRSVVARENEVFFLLPFAARLHKLKDFASHLNLAAFVCLRFTFP